MKNKKLYVMQCNNFIKIGVSDNPERRIKDLQTGNPYEIKLLLAIDDYDAYGLENQFHKYFKNINSIGEWFEVDENVKYFVKYLKIREYKESGGIG